MTAIDYKTARTAVLVMDYQNGILGAYPEPEQKRLLSQAPPLLDAAREAGLPVVYVRVAFRPGYPEVSSNNKLFSGIRSSGALQEGSDSAELCEAVAPKARDVVVTKRRVGAFSTTDLKAVLDARDIDQLILFGVSTSGVVLSTVRWAADADYRMTVVPDLCLDRDEEAHRVLVEKVFPRQAEVVSRDATLDALR